MNRTAWGVSDIHVFTGAMYSLCWCQCLFLFFGGWNWRQLNSLTEHSAMDTQLVRLLFIPEWWPQVGWMGMGMQLFPVGQWQLLIDDRDIDGHASSSSPLHTTSLPAGFFYSSILPPHFFSYQPSIHLLPQSSAVWYKLFKKSWSWRWSRKN